MVPMKCFLCCKAVIMCTPLLKTNPGAKQFNCHQIDIDGCHWMAEICLSFDSN